MNLDLLKEGLVSQDAGLTILRVATGFFFAGSGYHKLFNTEIRAKVTRLFQSLPIARPVLQARLVSWGEFLGGIGLMAGVLVVPASLGLIVIMLGAITMVTWKEVVAKKPCDLVDWCVKALYMPEGLLTLILIILAITGAGAHSGEAIFWAVSGL